MGYGIGCDTRLSSLVEDWVPYRLAIWVISVLLSIAELALLPDIALKLIAPVLTMVSYLGLMRIMNLVQDQWIYANDKYIRIPLVIIKSMDPHPWLRWSRYIRWRDCKCIDSIFDEQGGSGSMRTNLHA